MGEQTNIEWCDTTLNLWIGCTKLTAACDHCYAERLGKRFGIEWNAPPVKTTENSWGKLRSYQRGARRFANLHGRKRRVFINSLSDFFDNQAEPAWQLAACEDMEAGSDVIWILVTKRPQNIRRFVPPRWMRPNGWPANVWVLVTTENQEEYDRRVLALLDLPIPVRGISMEPLLGEIQPWAFHRNGADIAREIRLRFPRQRMPLFVHQLSWAIVGGESGAGARPMPQGAEIDLVRKAEINGLPVFFKQRSQATHPDTFKDYASFPPTLKRREHPIHD